MARAELRRLVNAAPLTAERLITALAEISRDAGINVSLGDGALYFRVAQPIEDAAQVSVEIAPEIIVAVADDWLDGALTWCCSALAPHLGCAAIIDGEVRRVHTEADLVATRGLLATAKRDLERREERVVAKRQGRTPNPPFAIAPVRALLHALARDGAIILVEGRDQGLAALEAFAEVPALLYEQMLDSSAIDEVFIDELEFIARWKSMLAKA